MDGARSMAGRKRRRTPAARSDADRTSSASLAEAGRLHRLGAEPLHDPHA